jgi:hypothetical protein
VTGSRGLLAVAVAMGVLVGAPAVAWAATEEYGFDATELGNQRLPADSSQDFVSPDVGGGRITSDMDGTACDSTYGLQLVRARSYLPDEVVHRFDGGRACDGPVTQSGLSWGRGRYHLDVRVVVRQESSFGRGFVRAQW